ncbi:MAG: DNA primase, partial [uncultured Ramlibacter sp.]
GHPPVFHPGVAGARRRGGDRRPLRAAEEDGRELLRPVPVPFGEVAVVHREPEQAVLPLLRLRQERQRDRLPDGACRHGLRGGGQGPGRPVRHGGARRRRLAAGARARRLAAAEAGHPHRRAGQGGRRLPQAPEELAQGHRLPQGPWPVGGSRQAVRPGLRARRLAHPGRRVPQLRRPAAGRRRPGDRGRGRPGQALRPLPRPRDVPHPQRQGRVHRLRRACAGGRETQVPELAGDAGVQQGPRAVRAVRGAQCRARSGLRAGDRGLHGRGR